MLLIRLNYDNISKDSRDVAQPGSAPEWGSGGRRFKSAHPDHFCTSYSPQFSVYSSQFTVLSFAHMLLQEIRFVSTAVK